MIKDNETIKRDLSDYLVDHVYGVGEAPWDRDYEDGRTIATFLISWVRYQQNAEGRNQRAMAMNWPNFLVSPAVQNLNARVIMPELERLVYEWLFGRPLNPQFATPVD